MAIMVKAIVGANWGDEGTGKLTDVLAQDADIVIRFQGGSNAGHTIVNNYGKFALHQLPQRRFPSEYHQYYWQWCGFQCGEFRQGTQKH